jgi:hypothetical protein
MPTLVVIGKCSTKLVVIEPANSEPNPTNTLIQCFSFVTKFHTRATKKSNTKGRKEVFEGKKKHQTRHTLKEKNMMLPYLDNRSFQQNKA